MPSSLDHLIALSPTLARWSEPHRQVLTQAHAAIEQTPGGGGLSLTELAHQLDGVDGLTGRELAQAIGKVVPALGLFRITADGRYTLRSLEELARPIDSLPLAVIDLEATGGRPPLHRAIEVAVVRREPDGETDAFESLANPGRPLPRFVAGMTGVNPAQLVHAPPVSDAVRELVRCAGGALLVFHGSPADTELINYERHLAGEPFLVEPICCTIALTRHLIPDQTLTGLDNVARRLGLGAEGLHRAMVDAELTLAVFETLSRQFAGAGLRTLADLAPFQGSLTPPPFLTSDISVPRLNALPEGPGAYVVRDVDRRVLLARISGRLRTDLTALFFPPGAIPDHLRSAHRGARFLDVRKAHDETQAPQILESMLSHETMRGPVGRHHGRHDGRGRADRRRGGPARTWGAGGGALHSGD